MDHNNVWKFGNPMYFFVFAFPTKECVSMVYGMIFQ
jgi:hypothetical protein